jgi:hypothetical protein
LQHLILLIGRCYKQLDFLQYIHHQEQLLQTLQLEWESKSPVLQKAKSELAIKAPLKPCPNCKAKKPYKRGMYNG